MDAAFRIVGSLHLPARRAFVLYGDILRGSVVAGQLLCIGDFGFCAPISAVEMVDFTNRRTAHVALLLHYESEGVLQLWAAFDYGGIVAEVLDDTASTAG